MKALSTTLLGLLLLAGCDSSQDNSAVNADIIVAFTDTLDTETALYSLTFDGALSRLPVPSGDLFSPTCAESSGAVAFEDYNASLVRGTPALQIYRDGHVRPAPPDPSSSLGDLPVTHGLLSSNAWSPDGRRFVTTTPEACLSAVGCFHRDLTIVDVEAEAVIPLTRGSEIDWNPLWDPYSDRIVFLSNRSGGQHVYSVRPDGSELIERASLPGEVYGLSWGPGPGMLTAGVLQSGDPFRYVTVNLETGVIQDLDFDTDPANTSSVVWHPDGRRYLSTVRTPFQATPHPNDIYTLYLNDAVSGERRALLERTREISYPPKASFCAP